MLLLLLFLLYGRFGCEYTHPSIEMNRMWSYHFIWSNTKWSLFFSLSLSFSFAFVCEQPDHNPNLIFGSGYILWKKESIPEMTTRLQHKTNLTSSLRPIERQSMAIKNLSACFVNVFWSVVYCYCCCCCDCDCDCCYCARRCCCCFSSISFYSFY